MGALTLLEVSYMCGIVWELSNSLLLGRWQRDWGCQADVERQDTARWEGKGKVELVKMCSVALD